MIERLNAALSERYHLVEQIGEGGMATVYLADDLRHERKVALKVLKPELAAVVGAERFLAEIKTTANLQHPHILPLYDSGEADSFVYYVMPYVKGATLDGRLEAEKQLPVDEAIRIARAVASALDFAHREGVVHRDIKPANILFQDGQPVVSDFGIALAVGAGRGARLTETGLSLGTPYYMSPEQATGDQQVGPRSDIYSLGSVLYEMLTGHPPYHGSTAQAILGQIITADPPLATEHRPSVPPHVDAAILKALEKVPADRFSTAVELSAALGNPAFRHGEAGFARADAPSTLLRWRVATVAASMVALLALASTAFRSKADTDPVQRYPIAAPAAMDQSAVRLSPDGSRIAWLVRGENTDDAGEPRAEESRIWVRERDAIDLTPVPGTEGAQAFRFSPDGGSLVFLIVGDTVRTVALDGGRFRTLLVAASAGWPDWADDGFIYLGSSGSDRRHMLRLPEEGGGEATPLAGTEDQDANFLGGDVLPGSEGMIVAWYEGGFSRETIQWGILDFDTGQRQFLANAVLASYAPSGHVVYLTATGQLMALPFDAKGLEVTGDPKVLDEGILNFTMSDMGDLITYHGTQPSLSYEVAWFDRDGTREPIDWSFGVTDVNTDPALSPDGTKIAVVSQQQDGRGARLKTKDLVTGAERIVGESFATRVAWSAGSRYLGIIEAEDTLERLVRIRADGSGRVEPMTDFVPGSSLRMGYWSPFDTIVVAGTPTGLNVANLADGTWTAMEVGDSIENPTLSPDGQWVAYNGVEGGEWRIFVRPFPGLDDGVWPVSNGEGFEPRWSRDGTEIFYLRIEPTGIGLVAAQVRTDPDFTVLGTEPLFQTQTGLSFLGGGWSYDVDETADRFIAARPRTVGGQTERIILTTNFFAELKRRFGEGHR